MPGERKGYRELLEALERCGPDDPKPLLYLQKFERHPSEHHAKDDWKAPAKVPQMPQEAGKADDPPPATRIESVRLRNGETFSWEQPPLL